MISALIVTLAIWIGPIPEGKKLFQSGELSNLAECDSKAQEMFIAFLMNNPDVDVTGVGYGCGEIRMMFMRPQPMPEGGA